jgi:DNA-binding SARP family transcriptional activator
LEVRDGGRPVALGGPQQRAVLALLLVQAGRVVSADRLADQLWGERPPPTARNLVQGCGAGLRRVLGGGVDGMLQTRPPGYLLRVDGAELDVHRFEELARDAAEAAEEGVLDDAAKRYTEALALWRGPALDGIAVPACRAEAEWLDERRLVVQELRIDVDLRRGRHVELVPELQVLARDHPVRERLWAQLIIALHRCERRGEALEAYRRVREALVEELGVEPGLALRELYRDVLGEPSPQAVVSPSIVDGPPAPAQLPPAVAAFTGRQAQLGWLSGLLDSPGGVAVAVVCGSAGVGKSALALEWAHRVRHRFDGGQLHINLRGYASTAPLRPVEALGGFLRALGVPPDQIPADEAHATALYRTLLAGRRALVVLDNANTPEQVRPLAPSGPGSVVLVTSRAKLGGLVAHDGASHLTVDVFTAGEARALLVRVLGDGRVAAEPDAVEALIAQCARLPLALRIAAANLTLAPDRPVAELVAELAEGSHIAGLTVDGADTTAVRAAFDLSYEGMPPAARRMFRLGWVPSRAPT